MISQLDMLRVVILSGQRHRMQTASEMRFVSSNCGAVKPLDALVKELEVAGKTQPKR